jgi:hypothetical protein
MMVERGWSMAAGLFAILMAGCGASSGAPPVTAAEALPAVDDDAPAPPEEGVDDRTAAVPDRSSDRPEEEELPTTCAEDVPNDGKMCVVGAAYAKKLCAAVYPEVALTMFAKGTPWTRAYLRGEVEAWNASGGLTHRAQLAYQEEVIVLSRRAPPTGGVMMVGAAATYDVLRWDGSCVSIEQGEMTTRKPASPKPAEVAFRRLDESARRALLESPKVKGRYEALDKACSASDEASCEKASHALSVAIAEHVRGGAALPAPPRRP